ncbi:MAG: hypothetical protein WBB15_14485 [Ornithinimicrobium sp.]
MLASSPVVALLSLRPFAVVVLTGRSLLVRSLASGRLRDDSGVTLRFIQSEFRRRARVRIDILGACLLLGYLIFGFGGDIDDVALMISGAILWIVLGGLQVWGLIEFLAAERNGELPLPSPADPSDNGLLADQPKRPEM